MGSENNSLKGRANPEFSWVQLTEDAMSAFNGGRLSTAAEGWKKAHRFTKEFDEHDPRLAGSLNNLAIAFRIKHDFAEAERIYRSVLKKWEAANAWVAAMQLRPRARSSLFHLRLERKHLKKYDDMARRKYRKLPSAGQAVSLSNLAELCHTTNRLKEAEQYYHQALRKRIGSMDENEPGVAIIKTNLACLSSTFIKPSETISAIAQKSRGTGGFISRATRQGWIVDKPAEFTDEGRLMAAIYLTHLVDHTRLKPPKTDSNC